MVTFNHVSFSYTNDKNNTTILEDVSFHIEKNSFTAIIGPSGCGKSTILSLICGFYQPSKGQILLNSEITSPGKIGYMLQSDHLLEWRTIFKNICLGLEIQKIATKENMQKAHELLEKYGLSKYEKEKPSALSGGMRQRISLIRTLVLDPKLLLLDEPFSALDYQTRLEVSQDVYQMIKSEGKTAILVTHDISEAVSLADTVIVLSKSPCKIKSIIPIQLSKTQSIEDSRNSIEYKNYFNIIWKELQK